MLLEVKVCGGVPKTWVCIKHAMAPLWGLPKYWWDRRDRKMTFLTWGWQTGWQKH